MAWEGLVGQVTRKNQQIPVAGLVRLAPRPRAKEDNGHQTVTQPLLQGCNYLHKPGHCQAAGWHGHFVRNAPPPLRVTGISSAAIVTMSIIPLFCAQDITA